MFEKRTVIFSPKQSITRPLTDGKAGPPVVYCCSAWFHLSYSKCRDGNHESPRWIKSPTDSGRWKYRLFSFYQSYVAASLFKSTPDLYISKWVHHCLCEPKFSSARSDCLQFSKSFRLCYLLWLSSKLWPLTASQDWTFPVWGRGWAGGQLAFPT